MLVAGTGPAGLATAIELASAGLAVLVVGAAQPLERYGETVPPGIMARLDRLQLTEAFLAAGHLRCPGTVVRWGGEQLGHNDFVLDPLGPAWHLDRVRFETMLRDRAAAAGVRLATPARVRAVEAEIGRTLVTVEGVTVDGGASDSISGTARIAAGWLVDATGADGRRGRGFGAQRVVTDRLAALVRVADLRSGPFSAQTLVESAPEGWWYATRLPGDRLVTVLVTDPSQVRALTNDRWAGWSAALGSTTLLAGQLAGVEVGGWADTSTSWAVRPVRVSRTERATGHRWLSVGDAAAELDPVVGRGIHDALAGASRAARAVVTGLSHGGSETQAALRAYEAAVRAQFAAHLDERAAAYAGEHRWPDSPFWRSRRVRTPGRATG